MAGNFPLRRLLSFYFSAFQAICPFVGRGLLDILATQNRGFVLMMSFYLGMRQVVTRSAQT